ncbi:MAG: hypothetical protein NC123_20900 [Butyrivibrio sp.]|nr:hypothetical protein [Butyrivibrio sp.]
MEASFSSAENTVTEEIKSEAVENVEQKITIFRKWQAGSAAMIFAVYVDSKRLGKIDAGESLSGNVCSNSAVIEIRYYTEAQVLASCKKVVLVDMENARIDFSLSEGLVLQAGEFHFPKINITVKGAKILQQEQSFV